MWYMVRYSDILRSSPGTHALRLVPGSSFTVFRLPPAATRPPRPTPAFPMMSSPAPRAIPGVSRMLTPLLVVLALLSASRAGAQAGRLADLSRDLESRPSLEAEARTAEAQHRTSEAWLLRTRLQKGDFQDGDRIVVMLQGNPQMMDTVVVRAGRMLPLPRMADLPLEGVLRSELTARLTSHLAKYLRDSTVRATPLVRLAVLGQVGRPGYYYTAADVLISDVIMKAGGPSPNADLNNMVIRRSGDVIWDAQATRTALSDGLSLDRLHLRAGDELLLNEQEHRSLATYWQAAVTVLTLGFTLFRLR